MERVNSKGSFLTHPTNDARWLERRRPENVFDDNSDFDNRCQFISITSNGIYIMVKCMYVCMYVTFLLILPSPFFDISHFFQIFSAEFSKKIKKNVCSTLNVYFIQQPQDGAAIGCADKSTIRGQEILS